MTIREHEGITAGLQAWVPTKKKTADLAISGLGGIQRFRWGGTLWVQRRGDEPVSNGAIDIVSPDGGYVGTFAAGETSIPSSFGPDGLAAFIEMDEYDVSTIVVRRLPGAIN